MTKQEIIKALEGTLSHFNEPAGLTEEIIRDEQKYKEFMASLEERGEELVKLTEQALASLQGSIVIDKADVPDNLEYHINKIKGLFGEHTETCLKAAQLIVEGLKDE